MLTDFHINYKKIKKCHLIFKNLFVIYLILDIKRRPAYLVHFVT